MGLLKKPPERVARIYSERQRTMIRANNKTPLCPKTVSSGGTRIRLYDEQVFGLVPSMFRDRVSRNIEQIYLISRLAACVPRLKNNLQTMLVFGGIQIGAVVEKPVGTVRP